MPFLYREGSEDPQRPLAGNARITPSARRRAYPLHILTLNSLACVLLAWGREVILFIYTFTDII